MSTTNQDPMINNKKLAYRMRSSWAFMKEFLLISQIIQLMPTCHTCPFQKTKKYTNPPV